MSCPGIIACKSTGGRFTVYRCEAASYAVAFAAGTLQVEIEAPFPFRNVAIRTLHSGICPEIAGSAIRFTMTAPAKLSIELDGDLRRPLFLLLNPSEQERPDPGADRVIYFAAGQACDAGEIRLRQGETLYIEEGAVVRGWIEAEGADNISIKGRGILDGSGWRRGGGDRKHPMLRLVRCSNVVIEGMTIVDGPTWHVVPIACTDVSVRNLNVVTFNGTGDGIDIVGCERVEVDNCFIRSKDDGRSPYRSYAAMTLRI